MFAWHALWLIHSDSFLFLPHVERNRNGVPCWKTLFTNVASACPAWSLGLFLLHYMAGNRSWLGLAHVLPTPWRQPSSIILTTALRSHSAASLSKSSSLTVTSMQTLVGHVLAVQAKYTILHATWYMKLSCSYLYSLGLTIILELN